MSIIALVGRPNVGKSTIFNRLSKKRDALVADFAGLTRDRQYSKFYIHAQSHTIIDCGGIVELDKNENTIDNGVVEQAELAISEADIIWFICSGHDGWLAQDEQLLQKIRVLNKPIWLIVNKIDGLREHNINEFFATGLKPIGISATQGRNFRSLLNQLETYTKNQSPVEQEDNADASIERSDNVDTTKQPAIRVAIIGRPNVGKSTLINKILGDNRLLVSPVSGTTRDSVNVNISRGKNDFVLIDTAGIRRRKYKSDMIEKFSIVQSIEAIKQADIVIVMFDGSEGVVDQDLHLVQLVQEHNKPMILLINKTDGLNAEQKFILEQGLDRKMAFVAYSPILKVSALQGKGIKAIFSTTLELYQAAMLRYSTKKLNDLLRYAQDMHPPPHHGRFRIKMRHIQQASGYPPCFIIHGNNVEKTPDSYNRYLQKLLREQLGISGLFFRIIYRDTVNPFAHKKQQLTPRQIKQRQRVIKHVKR